MVCGGMRSIYSIEPLADIGLLTVICLGAGWIRMGLLDAPVGYDEAFSYRHYMRLPFWRAVWTYDLPNNHIFHTVCGWFVMRALPLSEITLRLPAFVSGVAIVPLTYVLGRHVSGPTTGLVAATLVAVDPALIHYSADARGYGLQTALFLGALCHVPRLLANERRTDVWWIAGLVALGVWTVPTLVFGIGIVIAWGLWLADLPERSGTTRVPRVGDGVRRGSRGCRDRVRAGAARASAPPMAGVAARSDRRPVSCRLPRRRRSSAGAPTRRNTARPDEIEFRGTAGAP